MKLTHLLRLAAQAALVGLLLIILVLVIQSVGRPEPSPLSQVTAPPGTFTPLPAKNDTPAGPTASSSVVAATARPNTPAPYPPPASQTPEAGPSATLPPAGPPATPPPPFPETPPLPDGFKAAALHGGDLWLLDPKAAPVQLTELGDISVIFSVSSDGTRMLFGRGRYPTSEYSGDTAELWLLDLGSGEARQFYPGQLVQLAAWSPAADRVAVCEYPNVLKILGMDGQMLHQMPDAICGFTWSPGGEALAVPTFTPEMVSPEDGLLYTVMAIWWPGENRLQRLSEESGEVHGLPIWSTDGTQLMFDRSYYLDVDKQPLSGAHVYNLSTGQITRLPSATPGAYGYTRSPKADRVAYILGEDVLVMDFEGNSEPAAKGSAPIWLPDGRTLLYRAPDGSLETVVIETDLLDRAVSGQTVASGFYVRPQYFIIPNEAPS